ncbi:GNAT family N-acetyltransferase [Caulobacter endophyticus]|uniref:30S ribosomal protein S5 alanine N-acetyltransferase n=1 Tax=Caulobacter endophyticus TaxID=2172652 RepID=A0A2T9JQB4_9CAUL|nr:GNAT family protein [Caulobacter endophyticus]PVM85826.1 30S ribosomal protein S5 alanine N-acetyltransferase [Caulobacter endophyticus]
MSAILRLLRIDHGPRIDAERVYLRLPRLADHKPWSELRAASRGYLTPWEPSWPADDLTRTAFRQRLAAYARELELGEAFPFFVFRKDDDAIVGGVRLFNIRRGVSQTGVLGYWVGESFAGQGYTTEAVKAVIDFAFGPLGLHRLEAACMPHNARSADLLSRCGFSEEGYARAYLKINGEWRDHRLFGLIAPS